MPGLSNYWRSRKSSYLPLEIAIALRQQQQLIENLDVKATIRLAETPRARLSDQDGERAITLATDLFALGAPLPEGMVDIMTGATLQQVGRMMHEPPNKRHLRGVLRTVDSVLDGPRVKNKLRGMNRGRFMLAYINRLDQFTSSPAFRESMAAAFRDEPGVSNLLYCYECNVDPSDMEATLTQDLGGGTTMDRFFSEEDISKAYDRISAGIKDYSRRRASRKVVTELLEALQDMGFRDRQSNARAMTRRGQPDPNSNPSAPSGSTRTDKDPMQSFMHRQHRAENLKESTLDKKIAEEVGELVEYKAEQFESEAIPDSYSVMKYTPSADHARYEKYRTQIAKWITPLKSRVGAIAQQPDRVRLQRSGRMDRRRAVDLAVLGSEDVFTRWQFEKKSKQSVVVVAIDLSGSVRQADVLPQAVLVWESLRDIGIVKVYGYQTDNNGRSGIVLWDMAPSRTGILHFGGITDNSQTVPAVSFEAAKQQFELYAGLKDRILIHLTDGHPNVLTEQVRPLLEELREMDVQELHLGVGNGYSPDGMTAWFGEDFKDVRDPANVPEALLKFFEVE